MTSRRERENGDIRILGGWTADGEVGSISTRKNGADGEEKGDKIAAAGDLSSGPQQGTDILVDEIQLFEVTNRNDEHGQEVVQGAGDPASTSTGKRKRMSVLARDANRSS